MMMTQAGFPCAAGLNLRIPARVAARHVSQIFGCAKYCALNACRSFSPKSFHRKYFGDCYHNVAKGVTALCLLRLNLPLTRLMRKGEPPRAKLLPKQRRREKTNCQPLCGVQWVVSQSHGIFPRQFAEKCVNSLSIPPQAGFPCAAGLNLRIPALMGKE